MEWRKPKSVQDAQYFLGFVNFYWLFIQIYSRFYSIDAPYLQGQAWKKLWSKPNLKTTFTMAPILIHLDLLKPFFFEIDAADYALSAILSQNGEDGRYYPIAFYSRKFTTTEINYEIHDKKLLAIINSFQEWSLHRPQ
jgi:hypothetical protein